MTTNVCSFCNEFAMFLRGFCNKIRTLAEGNNNRIQNGSILMPAAIAPRGWSAASHNQIHQDLVMTGVFFLTLNEWAKKAPFFVSTPSTQKNRLGQEAAGTADTARSSCNDQK